MKFWSTSRFVVLWIIYVFSPIVLCTGVFELKLSLFKNDLGLTNEGNCCNGVRNSDGHCSASCSTFFTVCLTHYQVVIDEARECTFASLTTPILGSNTIDFTVQLPVLFDNPQQFKFPYAWPGTFSLIIEAFHDRTQKGPTNGSPRDLIYDLKVRTSVEVGETWHYFTDRANKNRTLLSYSYRVLCDEHYYGDTCNDYCKPRNDHFGHYRCDENGTKICLAGWDGPYCNTAVCKAGCHPDNGYCGQPDECECRMGYGGPLCDQCITYPGCDHGTCTTKYECKCDEGWGGIFCNQDLNYCTHHSPCRNGGICKNTGQGLYTCSCPIEYTGTNCEIEVDDCERQPCTNGGTCQNSGNGFKCKCPEGYTGRRCETVAVSCENSPCQNNANCENKNKSYVCHCTPGYTGYNCEAEINECFTNPCQHEGRCVDELNGYRCECRIGFEGTHCETNIYDCTQTTCLNGGICIDKVNSFECQCKPGFFGSLCQDNPNDCEAKPCQNGGTCYDLANDFKCDCPPGFSGKDCSIYKNECQSQPCKNGGTCKKLSDDFECTCVPGFYGKDCSSQPEVTLAPGPNNSDNNDVITMTQLVLIVCLGVGIPLLLLIIVAIFLLLRRRNSVPHESNSRAKEKEQNIQNSINNKLESAIFTTSPHTSSSTSNVSNVKLTNEENDFNTFKPGKQLLEKATNKNFLYKEVNTQREQFSKTPPPLVPPLPPRKDINKYSDTYDTAYSQGSSAVNDISCYNATDIHIIGAKSRTFNTKETNRHSGALVLDPHPHRQSYYSPDDVLATEV